MIETITLDRSVYVSGFDMAIALKNTYNPKAKQRWIDDFMGHIGDYEYDAIIKFCAENPVESTKPTTQKEKT